MKGTNEKVAPGTVLAPPGSYLVTEIYETIQGEGANVGTPITLVRFAKCNLACSFCDTNFDHGTVLSLDELCSMLSTAGAVMLTGGEPLLQVDTQLLGALMGKCNKRVFIETSGTVTPKWGGKVTWLVVSPKTETPNVAPHWIDEMRIPVSEDTSDGHVMRIMRTRATIYYVSPIFKDDTTIDQGALTRCLELTKKFPALRLSVQLHKLLGLK